MKSSFASRYANACEGKFQFRLRQDKIHKSRPEEIVDLGLYYVKDHYAQDIVVANIEDLEKFLQQCEEEYEC
jgi:hypothetical protein